MKFLRSIWTACAWCARGIWTVGLWTLWLALALLLVVQAYIASTSRLEVPGFLLRGLEERLAASGIRTTFGRTTFDPTGRVLIEDLRISLPAFTEPVIAARAVYVSLDPWALAAGKFEPRAVRVTGTSLAVPAMLSPTGRVEDVLRNLDATFVPREHELAITQFSAYVAGIAVSAHGAIFLPRLAPTASAPLPAPDFFARNFPAICRQLVAIAEKLAALDQPSLQLELDPSDTRLAIATVTLLARGVTLAEPLPVQASGLRVTTRIPLFGDTPVMARLEVGADELRLPFDAVAQNARVSIRGILRPGQFGFVPEEAELSAGSLTAAGFSARSLAARLTPGPLPQLTADAVAQIMGAPLAVRASVDFQARSATLHFDGALSPAVLDPLSARLHADVRKFFDFAALECADGEVRFGPGWKFENVSARATVHGIDAYHVHMDEGRAVVEFDGRHFRSPEAWARLGENFARGTYEHDLVTRDYRFLLEGRLRPLDISGWFQSGWWERFFRQFELPVAPPTASVDVQGRWTDGRQSAVFIYVDPVGPVIRGVKLDRARALLFVRPAFYDGLEIFATRDTGTARGTFTYVTDPAAFNWRSLEFDLVSSLDPSVASQMIGPAGAALLDPFKFAQPPALKLNARLDSPEAPGGAHQTMHIDARSPGEFRFHGFPLENVAFTATVRDDEIALDNLRAGFADGVATGRAKIRGLGAERTLRFDVTLKDAALGRAAAALQDFAARRKGVPPTAPGKFVQEKANVRLDLTAGAEGRYDDPFSYKGEGTALLQGAEIGEVPLLGVLSEVLRFTALRFTSARTTFRIEGRKLVFPEFNLRGANSAIDAHGEYALDRGNLDFKAKIYPFHESGNLIKSVVGVVLTPFSEVFEVNLAGPLEKPSATLAVGPSSFLRSLAPGENSGSPKPAESTPSSPAPSTPPPPSPTTAGPAASPSPPPPEPLPPAPKS